MAEVLLTAAGLGKAYRGRTVLDGVDLAVAAGETVGLVGTSGAGKSTLTRCLAGLERPSAGTVTWEGAPLGRGRHRGVQTVFQDPRAVLNPRWTVGRSIAEPLVTWCRELGAAGRRARVAELLDRVHLPAVLAERYPHELSTGQCQRVCLARALAPDPRLILLDEPLSALDLPAQSRILRLLGEVQADTGTAYLFVSHDIVVVATVCARILVLHEGRIVEEARAHDLLTAARHPHTRALVADTPRLPASARPSGR
ncbi:ABC transporter ATP-binding protein [Pseudonocardia sp. WMMC193]|uniref:ABC transporter ATP-binding protein n=1 Tax=Pseudonocardia sp. WMMC193 TaxID=2911965 RepID=UPI001F469131|nr:ABC transporter ATP-binding protein [Pseudonocardia sp. WMMC193]MCF7547853.1 ABC transporter ATP-binding protein [Pseudonocardia sp. WMMC193]